MVAGIGFVCRCNSFKESQARLSLVGLRTLWKIRSGKRLASKLPVEWLALQLPADEAISILRRYRQQHPLTKFLLLLSRPSHLLGSITEEGAVAYLPSSATEEELRAALQDVNAGMTHVHSSLAKFLTQQKRALTKSEERLLKLYCEGLSAAAIMDALTVSRNTVKRHCANLYRKLGVNSRVQAILKGIELGLVTPVLPRHD